jgi:F-type H+-transporting ATPase subunit gamma
VASAKELKKKIKSISNTKKITRTMEMVSTSKAKRTQGRVQATTPYSKKLAELLESLSEAAGGGAAGGQTIDHYLLLEPETVTRNSLLVVTANRGLCGAYNSNVVHLAEKWMASEREAGRETDVSMIGKKGIARFRFRQLPLHAAITHIEDKVSFQEAEELARGFLERFRSGEVGRVMVAVTRYFSAGVQKPVLLQLLPIIPPKAQQPAPPKGVEAKTPAASKRGVREFIFEPEPRQILEALLPFSVAHLVYRLLVEAAACEQIARKVAMKLATDNAEELIRVYTRKYNRQRQSGITQQIAEIVTAADALG